MHTLNMVLVNLKDLPKQGRRAARNLDRDQVIEIVRSFAEEMTEQYEGHVFDWRETDTAGRWQPEFDPNVIFAEDDVDRFVGILKKIQEVQKKAIDRYLEELRRTAGTLDLGELANRDLKFDTVYSLREATQMICGVYTEESMFYDTGSFMSRLPDETLDKIQKNPEDWAMAVFDYHW